MDLYDVLEEKLKIPRKTIRMAFNKSSLKEASKSLGIHYAELFKLVLETLGVPMERQYVLSQTKYLRLKGDLYIFSLSSPTTKPSNKK